MVSLTFFGGIGEIGGNKILLEDHETRVWLDFGKSFTRGSDFYMEFLQPRSVNGLGDYFEFDLIPKLQGLYSKDYLLSTDLNYKEPLYNGILLSHAHFDHCGHIEFIDPKIPVYTGAGTKLFLESIEETNSSKYGVHDYKTFRTGDRIKIDDLIIEPVHVDHSIPGAYGFVIHTSEGCIIYTGDFRTHGPKAEMTEDLLNRAETFSQISLITEGTRMEPSSRRKNLSEQQVLDGIREICRSKDSAWKPILYTHGPRDMDRLNTFYTIAKECGRIIVINPRIAYLLKKLREDIHLDFPDPSNDDNIGVYYKRKKTGTYDDRDYYIWEREFLDKMITFREIQSNPSSYMVNLDFMNFTELIDIRPQVGSPFILSMSEPFTEEDLEAKIFHNWITHFGLKYNQLHASGHIGKTELMSVIKRINPKILFPVHTEHPEMFQDLVSGVLLPQKNHEYQI